MMTPYVVTRYYRAPEVILGMKYKENGKEAYFDMQYINEYWCIFAVFENDRLTWV